MKLLITVLPMLFFISSASATTFSQKRAEDMVKVLNSDAVQELLIQEDGVGNIESIKFVPTMTGIAQYELEFSSYAGLGTQICKVTASLSGNSTQLSGLKCESKVGVTPGDSKVCKNPSPIGCQD